MKMKDMNNEAKPREKLKTKGINSLSDVEILALILGVGNKNESVLELSNRLINEYGLDGLYKLSYDELILLDGIKEGKATRLISTFELGRRAMAMKNDKESLLKITDIYNYVRGTFSMLAHERIGLLLLDVKLRPIYLYTLDGGMSEARVNVKEMVKLAINKNADSVVLIHNHPSNDNKPSKSDVITTNYINNVFSSIGIKLLDHIIITNDSYYSFKIKNILMENMDDL